LWDRIKELDSFFEKKYRYVTTIKIYPEAVIPAGSYDFFEQIGRSNSQIEAIVKIVRIVIAAHKTIPPLSPPNNPSSFSPQKPKKKEGNTRKSCTRKDHERKLKDCVIDFVNQSTQGVTVKLGELTKAHNLRPEVFRKGTKGHELMQAALKVVAKDRKGDKNAIQEFVIKLLEKLPK